MTSDYNDSLLRNIWNEVSLTVDDLQLVDFIIYHQPHIGFYNLKTNKHFKLNGDHMYGRWLYGHIQIEVCIESYNMYIPLIEILDDNPDLLKEFQNRKYCYTIHEYLHCMMGIDRTQTAQIADYLRMEVFTRRIPHYISEMDYSYISLYVYEDISELIKQYIEPWLTIKKHV